MFLFPTIFVLGLLVPQADAGFSDFFSGLQDKISYVLDGASSLVSDAGEGLQDASNYLFGWGALSETQLQEVLEKI